MSKSYGNEIQLADDPKTIRKKVMPMITDPARKLRTDPGNPEICPVFDHHKVFSDIETQAWADEGCRTAGIGCVDCKKRLLEGMLPAIEPVYERRKKLETRPGHVRDILMEGSRQARKIAQATLVEVRQAMQIEYDDLPGGDQT